MPNLDGMQLAKRMRNYNTTVKILVVTAFFADELFRKEAFQEAHISDVIEKPFRVKDPKPRLEKLC